MSWPKWLENCYGHAWTKRHLSTIFNQLSIWQCKQGTVSSCSKSNCGLCKVGKQDLPFQCLETSSVFLREHFCTQSVESGTVQIFLSAHIPLLEREMWEEGNTFAFPDSSAVRISKKLTKAWKQKNVAGKLGCLAARKNRKLILSAFQVPDFYP